MGFTEHDGTSCVMGSCLCMLKVVQMFLQNVYILMGYGEASNMCAWCIVHGGAPRNRVIRGVIVLHDVNESKYCAYVRMKLVFIYMSHPPGELKHESGLIPQCP